MYYMYIHYLELSGRVIFEARGFREIFESDFQDF